MKKVTIVFSFVLGALALLIFWSNAAVKAQGTQQREIYIWVQPQTVLPVQGQPQTTSPVPTDYVVKFRNTDAVGLITPKDATIIVYSNYDVIAEVYGITTDAGTGGYRYNSSVPVITSPVAPQNVYNNNFAKKYPQIEGSATFNATRPLSLLGDQGLEMLVVGTGGNFGQRTVQGVISLKFEPALASFQVAQMSGTNIEMGFPFLPGMTPITLIANKDVQVTSLISLPDGTEVTGALNVTYTRGQLVQLLGIQPKDLFDIMESEKIKIHPDRGLSTNYDPTHVLTMTLDEEPRQRTFNVGDRVGALDGARPKLQLVSGGVFGNGILEGFATVVRVDNEGRLIVKRQGGEAEEVVESWLVEVKP